ncbi:MAG: tRNA (adenosine(37)-N6)-threonylcarbamoyltransferase complex dimerization subunit type 1 TsaB [Lachnospiraceae bacterium]|nr:tRNA (adenosine(37)-N6)-threonylcarbamoyltransferase complex dimerization subunit type 1 TsaB [Lachnospiraceae bacterium]
MNILAIDASGLAASAAVLSDEVIKAEFCVCNKLTHSETLMPMIDQVINASGMSLKEIEAFAVTAGPGSFTGLRIGVATAKGLSEAMEKPLIGVPTVESIAQNMAGFDGIVVPLMDARRGETYTGIYVFKGDELEVLREQCAVPLEEIINDVNDRGQRVVFLGDGVRVFRERIDKICTVPYYYAPADHRLQRAAGVAILAQKYYLEGRFTDAADLVPVYLRKSQAERERDNIRAHADA